MALPSNEEWAGRQRMIELAERCLQLTDTDMLSLLQKMRQLPEIPMHGPEHHGLVAAIILTAYRNSGGELPADLVVEGTLRANSIPGRSCGVLGVCGAAVGVGAAFALLLNSSPVKADEKKIVQTAVWDVTGQIVELGAPRCCQRECVLALKTAARLSERFLPIKLTAEKQFECQQWSECQECIGERCLLFPQSA